MRHRSIIPAVVVLLAVAIGGLAEACAAASTRTLTVQACPLPNPNSAAPTALQARPPAALLAILGVLRRSERAGDRLAPAVLDHIRAPGIAVEINYSRLALTTTDGARFYLLPAQFSRPGGPSTVSNCGARATVLPVAPTTLLILHTDSRGRPLGGGESALLAQPQHIRAGLALTGSIAPEVVHGAGLVEGLVPDGVSSVTLIGRHDHRVTLAVSGNMFVWTGSHSLALELLAPKLIVWRDAHGRTLARIHYDPCRLLPPSVRPICERHAAAAPPFPTGPPPLPKGATILAVGRAPDGARYTIAVAAGPAQRYRGRILCPFQLFVLFGSGGGGGCVPGTAPMLLPQALTCTGGAQLATYSGSVSSRVRAIRVLLPGGRALNAPVYALPPKLDPAVGVYVLFAPRAIEHAIQWQSIGAGGRILARAPGGTIPDCFSHPVTSLSPGVVPIAVLKLPDSRVVTFSMQRVRFEGTVDLCIQQGYEQQCPPYPRSHAAPAFVLAFGPGSCGAQPWQLVAAVLWRPDTTAWLRTSAGVSELTHLSVPTAFGVRGGFFYGLARSAPATLLVKNSSGKTVYSTNAIGPSPPGHRCAGLNPSPSS